MKTLKTNANSKSGRTFYFSVKVPAGVLETSEGMFCGTCEKKIARIDEISWTFCFGKNFRRYINITNNGKHQLRDYISVIEKYCEQEGLKPRDFYGDVWELRRTPVSEMLENIDVEECLTDEDFDILEKTNFDEVGTFERDIEEFVVDDEKVEKLLERLSDAARPVVDWAIRNAIFQDLEFKDYMDDNMDSYYERKYGKF